MWNVIYTNFSTHLNNFLKRFDAPTNEPHKTRISGGKWIFCQNDQNIIDISLVLILKYIVYEFYGCMSVFKESRIFWKNNFFKKQIEKTFFFQISKHFVCFFFNLLKYSRNWKPKVFRKKHFSIFFWKYTNFLKNTRARRQAFLVESGNKLVTPKLSSWINFGTKKQKGIWEELLIHFLEISLNRDQGSTSAVNLAGKGRKAQGRKFSRNVLPAKGKGMNFWPVPGRVSNLDSNLVTMFDKSLFSHVWIVVFTPPILDVYLYNVWNINFTCLSPCKN